MPGGEKLRKAKLRGVASEGMILAADELEVGEDHDGILVLDDSLAAGAPLTDVIPLAEPVLEIEVTPNRSDCFGVHGVAREVHAVTGAALGADPWAEDAPADGAGTVDELASVTVEVPELCPRFTARAFLEVEIGPSPLWLQQRLSAAGQRPINNVVDITNYVMLLTAQPLHAYDLDKVPGGELIVRTAAAGEKMTTLDGVERTLDAETVARLRPRRPDRDRRGDGRPGLRGLRRDHPGPARGGELERDQHPPHLAPARAALRGLGPVREAAPPGADDAGAADRLAAPGRALPGRSWCRGRSTSPRRSRRRGP